MMFGVPFLIVALAASSCYGREYKCIEDEALCTGSGKRSITLNGMTKCCPPQASITLNNNNCLCVEAPAANDEFTCLQGTQQCARVGASSFTTDSKGDLRCCPQGFHMTSFLKDLQGQVTESCTCKRRSRSSVSSFQAGLGNGGGSSMTMSALGPGLFARVNQSAAGNGNATGDGLDQWRQLGQSWKNWGQEFAKGFGKWGRNFGQRMRSTGRDLARDMSGAVQTSLTRSTLPIQRALNDMLGNIFLSIPGK